MSRRSSASLLLLASLLATPSFAQSDVYTQEGFEDLPPVSDRPGAAPPPPLVFELQEEVSLAGPLLGSAPRWSGGKVIVDLADGALAIDTTVSPPAATRIDGPAGEPLDPEGWVEDVDGSMRYRTRTRGLLIAQRRCRSCRDGWRRAWKLRIAGATVAPPLVMPGGVCLGTLGNQIYCVKPRRGFRLWTADLNGRLSAPLVSAPSPAAPTEDRPAAPVILALPDSGDRLLAFDAATGVELGRLSLREQERLVGGVLTTVDGTIVVARQGYTSAVAHLVTYRLRPLAPLGERLSEPQSTAGPR